MIELLDFAVAEDCGTMVNPMIVEGQIRGGVAQGIGTALYEEIPYDEQGQPLVGTLADYLVPGAAELPAIKIAHLQHADAAHRVWRQGHGRRRRHRAARRHRQRGARRPCPARRRGQRNAADAATGAGRHPGGAAPVVARLKGQVMANKKPTAKAATKKAKKLGPWQNVLVEVEDGIAWVTLNRPEKRNAMNPPLNNDMVEVLDAVELEKSAGVLVLTGAGDSFSAGMDLRNIFARSTRCPMSSSCMPAARRGSGNGRC